MAARVLHLACAIVFAHAWNHRTNVAPRLSKLEGRKNDRESPQKRAHTRRHAIGALPDVAPRLSKLAAPQKRPRFIESQARRHAIIGALLSIPTQALAGADCIKDCTTNCNRVSGGKNDAYCGVQCEDYCGQTDREDGLSGSVSSSKGYLGWSSPLRLGNTVEYGEDRPPTVSIIPKSLLPDASIAREK